MKKRIINKEYFDEQYYSAVQTLALLADTQDMYFELGRGSGKTTHILGPRIDRVQNSMPGSVQVFLASTYKSIFENLVPGIMEFFTDHYEEDMYYSIGKRPPAHFKPCRTLITDWKNTISFVNGTVIQFVSCERPERANGKNIAHLYMDEMLHIKQRVVDENVRPAMRSKSTCFYDSPYFMGTTGTTSTPNIETDQDWFLKYENKMDPEKIRTIQAIALELDHRYYMLENAQLRNDEVAIRKLTNYCRRIEAMLTQLRRGSIYYLRASSFSNIKILGTDYIQKQMEGTLDKASLNTSIFAVRENRVKDMFFGHFGLKYIESDTYKLERIESLSIGEEANFTCADMRNCNLDAPLYIGYDPGPFTSMVIGQYNEDRTVFHVLKDIYTYWPEQQPQLAYLFQNFFAPMRNKQIFLHYDRAGNQRDPQWKKYKPTFGDESDTDAQTLKMELEQRGWNVDLMSLGQPTIYYKQHLHLLSRLFSGKDDFQVHGIPVIKIRIDENECEALISSIYNSPLKRTGGEVELDKSSEKKPFEEQAFGSTQIASALMYLLWGEFSKKYLNVADHHDLSGGYGGFTGIA